MKELPMEHDLCGPYTLNCSCNLPGHTLHFWFDNHDSGPYLSVTVCMSPGAGFFRRLWTALKYVFCKREALWEYSDTLLDKQGIKELKKYVDDCTNNLEPEYVSVKPVK